MMVDGKVFVARLYERQSAKGNRYFSCSCRTAAKSP